MNRQDLIEVTRRVEQLTAGKGFSWDTIEDITVLLAYKTAKKLVELDEKVELLIKQACDKGESS